MNSQLWYHGIYSFNIKKEDEIYISEKSLIYDILKENIEDRISTNFLKIFEKRIELTVNKIPNIFNLYLQLIFKDIKDEIKKYQILDENDKKDKLEKTKKILDIYFKKEEIVIRKVDLEKAIRIFTSLVLFREKDKENKIKLNIKNIFDYFKSPDLWDNKIYKDKRFIQNLNELKLCNIQINQIIWLYSYLVGNEEIGVFKEIEEYIRYKNNSTSYFKNKYNDVSYDDEISNHDFSSASNDSDSDSDSNSKNGKESDENNIIKIN